MTALVLVLHCPASMEITVWWLKDLAGVHTRCSLHSGEHDACEIRLEQDGAVIHAEPQPNIKVSVVRAKAMWIECQLDGWTE